MSGSGCWEEQSGTDGWREGEREGRREERGRKKEVEGGGGGRGQGISTCTIHYIIMPHNVDLNFHALSYVIQT